MHLRFTDQEFVTLIQMLSLAADVAAWNHKEEAQPGVAAFEELESRLLEKAAHAGLGEMVEFDEERRCYRMRQDLDQPFFFQECYDEFRNESFWDELAIRLSDRDLARAIGIKAWEALSEDDRRARTKEQEKRYWDEFSKNGIERVIVINPPGEG